MFESKIEEILETRELAEYKNQWNSSLQEALAAVLKKTGKKEVSQDVDVADIPLLLERFTSEGLKGKRGKNRFVVFSATAGAGKSTIGKELEKHDFVKCPRVTTRDKRPDEIGPTDENGNPLSDYKKILAQVLEGRHYDYVFVDRQSYDRYEKEGEFLHSKTTYSEGRAISRVLLQGLLDSGKKFYAEGSVQYYRRLLKDIEFLSLFVLPPSFEEMVRRIISQPIPQEEVKERLSKAAKYIKDSAKWYLEGLIDGYIVNETGKLQETVGKILNVF